MATANKPTKFTEYLEEKRKLAEAAQKNPELEIDLSPAKIVKEQKRKELYGSRTGISKTSKSVVDKDQHASFQFRVQERISTAKSGASNGSAGGIAFFNQGVAADPPLNGDVSRIAEAKTTSLPQPTSKILSVSSPAPKPGSSSKPVPHVTKPQTPMNVPTLPAASAVPPMQSTGGPDSLRPFTSDSKRLNQKVSTPKFSSVQPGLILSQQNTATRSGSTGLPPPSAGGSIIHAMQTGRSPATAGSRPGTGPVVIRPGTGASAGRPGTGLSILGGQGSAAKMGEIMQARLKKLALTSMARNGQITEEEYNDHLEKVKYNAIVAKLKEKISHNANSLGTHFSQLDENGNGVLEKKEFRKALEEMNLGPEIDDFVFTHLMKSADIDMSDNVDYNEFAQAIRIGNIPYMPLNPNIKSKTGPDPDNPLGDPDNATGLPFAIQSDATVNIQKFDARVDSMYKNLEETFLEFDEDQSGEVDWPEFKKAMRILRERKGIHLSDEEVKGLFRAADYDHSGAINWQEFVQSFQGGAGKRFIPEFMKPKSMRCSMVGAPWEWRAEPLEKYASPPIAADKTPREDQ